MRRTATTTVTTASAPNRFGGHALVGHATAARVMWTVEDNEQGSSVSLDVTVMRTGALDRMLLRLGGSWWLKRCLAQALDRLALEHELTAVQRPQA